MHPNSYRPHRTRDTSGTSLNLRVRIGYGGVLTCIQTALPNPALSSGIPDPQPTALHARLYHIARLRTTHAHSVSIATTQEGRACKARNQSAHMRAAWECANARAWVQCMGARRGSGSPTPALRHSGKLYAPWKRLYTRQHTCNRAGWAMESPKQVVACGAVFVTSHVHMHMRHHTRARICNGKRGDAVC